MSKKSIFSDLPVLGRHGLNSGRPFPKPLKVEKVAPEAKKVAKKPIKRVSVKHQNELKEYNKIAKRFLKANPMCEVYPTLNATEIHHVCGRLGTFLTDTTFFMAVSRVGHVKIHNNVAWAKEQGYILNRFKQLSQ